MGLGLRPPLANVEPLQTNSNAAINTERILCPKFCPKHSWDPIVCWNKGLVRKGEQTVTFARFCSIFAV